MSQQQNLVERRESFRVDERCHLRYILCEPCLVSEDKLLDALFTEEEKKLYDLRIQFKAIDHKNQESLAKVGAEQPQLASCLKAINQKIDLLSAQLLCSNLSAQWVSLSLGGMAFCSRDPKLKIETHLKIRLTLMPQAETLIIDGQVVDIEEQGDKHRVSVRFLNLSTSDEKILSQHIMAVQSSQHRHNEA